MRDDIFLDIETIGSQDPAVQAEIEAKHVVSDVLPEIKADARLTDPAKIATDIAMRTEKAKTGLAAAKANAAAAAEEEWRRTALDGGRGHVFSIAWAIGDGEIMSACAMRQSDWKAGKWAKYEEARLLDAFFDDINMYEPPELVGDQTCGPPRIVAHHADFDIRFLFQRAVVLGVRPPWWWPINVPTWKNEKVFCTSHEWAGHAGKIKLDALCKILGVPGKGDGIDGSKVWDAVRDGRIDEVVSYNRDDVARLRACFRKLTFAPPAAAQATEAA
jgi:hypothetical protein